MPITYICMRSDLARANINSTKDTYFAKAWFKRRILHAPNQILILVDSN